MRPFLFRCLMPDSNLTAALALAEGGVKIFPAGTDKAPLFKRWQEIATTERDIISEWWRRAPYALPAIPCGANGLLVLDLDRHRNAPDGVRAFKELIARHGALPPDVPVVKTPNGGGLHLYFRQPPGEPLGNGRGSLPPGCDVRGLGGFTIGPGATLPDGRGWIRVAGRPPITQPARLAWIEGILRRPADPPHEDHLAGETSDQRGRAYAEQALHEIEHELARTREGERNERLYKSAFRLATMVARRWLAESDIRNALHAACQANGLIKDDGRPAFQRTLDSGLADGLKAPHQDLRDRHAHEDKGPDDIKDDVRNDAEPPRRQATGDWDEPDVSILDDRRGDLPEFPCETLPTLWQPWLAGAAHGAGVTAGHVAVPAITTAAGLVGTAMRVRASRSWSEPLTLWSSLIGFSGTGKTAGIDVTKRTLAMIERIRKERVLELQRQHDTKAETAKAELKQWKKQVEEAVTEGRLPPAMPATAVEPGAFVAPRLYISDSTIERLAVLLQAKPRGALLIADELAGLFANMGRYSSGSDREFWLEAWNGKSFVVERLGRPPVHVEHLLVGMVGGFQPDKLARAFEGDNDGMHARLLFAWPDESPHRLLTNEIEEVEPEVVNALARLVDLPDQEEGVFASRTIALSAKACAAFEDFRAQHHKDKAALDGREREWFAKGPTQILRLSATLALMDWARRGGPLPSEVEVASVESAVQLWRGYFWPHAVAAVRQIGVSDRHADARKVLRWLKAGNRKEVSREEVRREALTRRLDAEQVQAIIDRLVRAGWLREVTTKAEGPGRPARRWEVNPRLSIIH